MKKTFATLFAASVCAASQASTVTYGWEDQDASVFGTFGNIQIDGVKTGSLTAYNATTIGAPDAADSYTVTGASEGSYYFHVSEQEHSSTPNAIIASVTGVNAGDIITVSLDTWDDTEGVSPSLRMWFSRVNASNEFSGSAVSSNIDASFSPGTGGWNASTATYIVDAADLASANFAGIGIQARLYSSPGTDATLFTDYLLDNLQITVETSSSTAAVNLPNGTSVVVPEPASVALLAAGGLLVVRRRRA